MKLEVADVGTGILFLFVKALLELAVLSEAALLSHLALLFLGFDDTAFFTEDAHLAVKHLVFSELALQ